jgi:hypothetical protein
MTLNQTLQKMKAASLAKIRPEAAAIMASTKAQLKASGIIKMALGPGQKAPDFELKDWQDNLFKSTEILARGPLVLTFYRGSW